MFNKNTPTSVVSNFRSIALVAAMLGTSTAWAQPDGPPPGGQNDRMMQQMDERQADALRKTLKKFGYKDKDMQGAIVAYAQQQNAARLPLLMATMRLARVVRNKEASDDEVRQALAEIRGATGDERRRRLESREDRLGAESALDAKINFSKNPRLEATLMMMGILGDETEMLAGAAPGYESEVEAPERGPGGPGGDIGGGGGMGRRGGGMGGGGMGMPGGW